MWRDEQGEENAQASSGMRGARHGCTASSHCAACSGRCCIRAGMQDCPLRRLPYISVTYWSQGTRKMLCLYIEHVRYSCSQTLVYQSRVPQSKGPTAQSALTRPMDCLVTGCASLHGLTEYAMMVRFKSYHHPFCFKHAHAPHCPRPPSDPEQSTSLSAL